MNRRRTVEMCRIGCFESFGEESLLLNQPMSYSVISSQPVELAVIDRTALQGDFQFHILIACRKKLPKMTPFVWFSSLQKALIDMYDFCDWPKVNKQMTYEAGYYPTNATQVCILWYIFRSHPYSLLVTDISATVRPISVKVCTVVELCPRTSFATFDGYIFWGHQMQG